MKKPDATTVISRDNFRQKVWPLAAEELLYVGPATKRRLYGRNIRTIGDIARCQPEDMRCILGKNGEMLWAFANGYDRSPVLNIGEEAAVKSVGNSTTTPRDIRDDTDAHMVLMVLSESVAERLRHQGLKGRVVSISVRDCDLYTFTCQKKLNSATALASEICACAMMLFRTHYRWERPVRSMGVSVSCLESVEGDQQISMFPDTARERKYDLEGAVEDIRRRFGHFSILRASLVGCREFGLINPRDDHVIHPVGWRNGASKGGG